MNVAVLITCHNRREHTLRCLRSLFAQREIDGLKLKTWLVDDGSTDGTSSAVAAEFPQVERVAGDGNLFWCGGMALAWQHAAASKPDAFLWLNDDVTLDEEALASLCDVARENPEAVVIGSCRCPNSGRRTYGGLCRTGPHPGKLSPVEPTEEPVRCDTFEGNIVWVPGETYAQIGPLDRFRHAMGDIDYGYRAAERQIPLLIAPGFLGVCAANSRKGTWEDPAVRRRDRWKKLRSVKGLPSQDWWRFCRKHGGVRAPWYFVSPFFRVLAGR